MSSIDREELDAVSNHISNLPTIGALYAPVLVEHCRALLAEVERLTAERDAAFKRGVAAMREAVNNVLETHDPDEWAFALEALPDPEDTP